MKIASCLQRGILTLGVFVALATLAVACPNCKDALAQNDPQHQALVQGYFYSILFMMSMPFLLIGSFGSYMYLEVRKARAAQQREESVK